MPKIINLVGLVFGRLTVLEMSGRGGNQIKWKCLCVCGTITEVFGVSLRSGHTRSCGCLNNEILGNRCRTHGMSRSGNFLKEYKTWHSMKGRCASRHKNYGGRGIKVCDRWLNSFENFLADMGPCPSPKHSIERIDNDGNYEPGNCRWATLLEQSNNTRKNVFIEYRGKRLSVSRWAARMGIARQTLYARISKNLTVEQILGIRAIKGG